VLLLKHQMWKHSVHCQVLKGAKVKLFQGRKQKLYSFLFTLPKVAPLHSGLSLSIFRRKITKIALFIPREVPTVSLHFV